MQPDEAITHAVRQGDRAAFEALATRHAGPVRGFLLSKLGSLEAAEEAAQETFVRAYTAIGSLQEQHKLLSWLLGIAANVAAEGLRRDAMRQSLGPVLERSPPEVPSEDPGLTRAVERLPEPYRRTVLLRYWAQMSCEQIAATLDCPVGTVTKQLSRAHALLRASLELGSARSRKKEILHELRTDP